MCSTVTDLWSCSLQVDGEWMLIPVSHPTSMEEDRHIQHFLLHPQMYWHFSKGVGFAYQEEVSWSHVQAVHNPPQGQYGWEALSFPFSQRDKHPLWQIFPDPEKVDGWEVNGATRELLQKCRDAAQCVVPCNSLWTLGSIVPSTCSTPQKHCHCLP